uniref:Acyl-CoA-binding domain-containing protein 6 n=1 Tax=Anser brachyrhynchus TaxID=132585 RepID=A0A8B9CK58_9AVES
MASPSVAAGSGGEGSSGSGSGGAEPPGRHLPALFEQAAERLPGLLGAASKEQLLYLYARYKQVKFGACNTPKPSFFDFEGKQKWEAWKALGDTSPHQAMQEYVATVKKLDPSWNPQTTEKRGKESKTAFGGPVVSSLYQEETIRAGLCSTGRATEDTRSSFQYCYSTLPTLTARLVSEVWFTACMRPSHLWLGSEARVSGGRAMDPVAGGGLTPSSFSSCHTAAHQRSLHVPAAGRLGTFPYEWCVREMMERRKAPALEPFSFPGSGNR